ncbi:MAG TPA: type II secretion system inner membrane protein GspF [Caulobacteraceae bacterium]|nr:type II secretion system inner membrane protein GspF [Caulobacteraceae bacterium]
MTPFEYLAVDIAGRRRSGVVSAVDERTARQLLQRRKLAPMRITAAASAARPGRAPLFADKLGAKDLALVTRQLATLIAVAPLEESLRTIAAQADKPKVRRALTVVQTGVVEGYRLADAMARPGAGFPPLYRAMVAAGESSGSLPAVLERLADLKENEQQVRAKVTAALVYPLVLAATAALVVIALMTFVVPKVVDQFDSMGQTLPLLTRIVIGVSEAMRAFGLLGLLALALGVFAFAQGMRRPGFRRRVDAALLKLPVLGRLIRDVHAAQLARTLSTMIASGLPVLEGLTLTARTARNAVLREAMDGMAAAIREGSGLSTAMRRAAIFPPILVYMTASGENSGRLDVMLSRAAEYLEREFNTFTAAALSLLEPVIICVMGVVVATIVLSILLPILQINSLALG